jgi:hypothetical protein
LEKYPEPVIDMSIYKKSCGQFRLPMCQKATSPNNPTFQYSECKNFEDYFITKQNYGSGPIVTVPGADEVFRQPQPKMKTQPNSKTQDVKGLEWIRTILEQKCPGARIRLEPKENGIIAVNHLKKPYQCCISGVTHHSQNGYLTAFGYNTYVYHCHDKITCKHASVIITKPLPPFDWGPERKVNAYTDQYCRPLDTELQPDGNTWQVLSAPMSRGKTEVLNDYLCHMCEYHPKFSFITMAMRVALGIGLLARLRNILGLQFYQDVNWKYDTPDRIIIEYESTYKASRRYDCVVLDEAVSLLNAVGSPTNGIHQLHNWETFSAYLKHARHVIVLDADMESNGAIRKLVDHFTTEKTTVLINKLIAPPLKRHLVLYPHECIEQDEKMVSTHTNQNWEAHFKEAVQKITNKIGMVVSSKRWGDEFYKRLITEFGLQPDEILYYHADMDCAMFNALKNVNEVWGNPKIRVVMYTSKISVGTNVTTPFDYLFVQCSQGPRGRDLNQMIGRIRNLRNTTVDVLISRVDPFTEELMPGTQAYIAKYNQAILYYKDRQTYSLVLGPNDQFIRKHDLPLDLYVTYQLEPSGKWLWKMALDKGWDVSIAASSTPTEMPIPIGSYQEELWKTTMDLEFPISEITYRVSLDRIFSHTAMAVDYMLRDAYQIQSLMEWESVTPPLAQHFLDYNAFKKLQTHILTIRGLDALKQFLANPLLIEKFRQEEQKDNSSKFNFLSNHRISCLEKLPDLMCSLGLSSIMDFATEFGGHQLETLESRIHALRDLYHWSDKTKKPKTNLGILNHILTDLIGISIEKTARRRVAAGGKDKKVKTKNAQVCFYKLVLDPYIKTLCSYLKQATKPPRPVPHFIL